MKNSETNEETASAVALAALAWAVQDETRAQRLLALTGLTPDDLRSRISDRSLLAAVLGFLEAHEPDLLACAEALNLAPIELVAARGVLEP
jgi:hypothetical protein